MKNNSIRLVVAAGIGAALFVVIGSLIQIPTLVVPNTQIQLQYAVQSLLATVFGPVVGFLVGFLGHAFKDSLLYGAPWWSWVISSGIFGLVLGFAKKRLNLEKGVFDKKDLLFFNGAQLVASAVAWGLIAPVLDIVIYSEPSNKVFAQGLVAGLVNSVTVGFAGSILLSIYAKSQTKSNSLSKDA